jgi:HAD superfamily hydrolase (TIGR01484 family)
MTPITAPTPIAPTPSVPPVRHAHMSGQPVMIALDIDGTLTPSGSLDVPRPTAAAVTAVRRAGHHIVLSSGRSLAGILPIARALGLTRGWAVASNGAVIARLERVSETHPHGYALDSGDVRPLDARLVMTTALNARLPGLMIAVEEIGVGYYVSETFPDGLLRGEQTVLPVHELAALASPRIILRALGADDLISPLQAAGVTATPAADVGWIDVTGGGVSKASALETVRKRLRVDPADTIAVGDGINDLPALDWAARAVAMGHAPMEVRAAADEITGTLEEHGAAGVLRSLVDGTID